MASYEQANRTLRIDTPLGANAALLLELEGVEPISRPFLFNATMAVPDAAITEDKVRELLGQSVTLWIGPDPGGKPIHGTIRRLTRHLSEEHDGFVWRAEVVPALWFLSCRADCRIFQNVSVPDVLDKVLKQFGVQFVDKRLTATYPKMKYCVQYRETAFDFLSRLMEEVGIFYWHEHTDGKHTLVLADINAKAPMMEPDTFPYGKNWFDNRLEWYEQELEFRPGTWATRDHNFKTPANKLDAKTPTKLNVTGMASHEVFDYPGRHQTSGRGTELSRIRMEAEEARHRQLRGSTNTYLPVGVRVNFEGAAQEKPKELCLVTEVRHRARDTTFWAGDQGSTPRYSNDFTAIAANVPYRPARVTPRPIVQGPQTAVVTGPSGSEIHTDKWGRVVVRFPWDRNPDGSADESCSCWVRVSQGWAGQGWGMMHIPRVGHEVIVEFLEGDPDRPVITGRVYNNENMPPWALPANKTQSGVKSNSSLGGGGSNEFRFEDKKGSEEVYFHAEKDLNSLIENNEDRKVGGKGTGNRTTTIKTDDKLTIGNNLTTEVGVNKKTTVGANFDETIGANETRTVGGSITEMVTGSETRIIGGSILQTVTGGTTHIDGGSVNCIAVGGINLVSPAPINIASGAAVNVIAPARQQATPFWDTNVLTSLSNIVFQYQQTGIAITLTGLKIDNTSMYLNNFITTINTGALQLNNAAMETLTYGFKMQGGFYLKV